MLKLVFCPTAAAALSFYLLSASSFKVFFFTSRLVWPKKHIFSALFGSRFNLINDFGRYSTFAFCFRFDLSSGIISKLIPKLLTTLLIEQKIFFFGNYFEGYSENYCFKENKNKKSSYGSNHFECLFVNYIGIKCRRYPWNAGKGCRTLPVWIKSWREGRKIEQSIWIFRFWRYPRARCHCEIDETQKKTHLSPHAHEANGAKTSLTAKSSNFLVSHRNHPFVPLHPHTPRRILINSKPTREGVRFQTFVW